MLPVIVCVVRAWELAAGDRLYVDDNGKQGIELALGVGTNNVCVLWCVCRAVDQTQRVLLKTWGGAFSLSQCLSQ